MSVDQSPGVVNTRRDMMSRSSLGFGLTALSGLLATDRSGVYASENTTALHAGRTRPSRAKSVIFCFMSGGVSAVDTFDPKPRLKCQRQHHGQSVGVQ